MPVDRVKFSVLICTYNRHEMLARCLAALIDGTQEKPDQVVIVNGGDARADAIVAAARERAQRNHWAIEIELVNTLNKNVAASRNLGLPCCMGDIVATTDDDAEVFPDWVTHMKRLHAEHPEAGAIGGKIIGANRDSLVCRVSDLYTFASPARPKYVATWPGVNIAYKRAALERVGPHDESFLRGEEVDYNWRIKQLGFEIYYDPAALVWHHHRASLRGLWDQFYMYGRGYYCVRRKWPEMHCLYPHRLSSPLALFKLMNFVLTLVYNPIQFAWRSPRFPDRIAAVPIIFMVMIAWRLGVLRQKFRADADPTAFQAATPSLIENSV